MKSALRWVHFFIHVLAAFVFLLYRLLLDILGIGKSFAEVADAFSEIFHTVAGVQFEFVRPDLVLKCVPSQGYRGSRQVTRQEVQVGIGFEHRQLAQVLLTQTKS